MSAYNPNSEPISVIINKLNPLDSIEAVDVGCGAARYDMLLYRYFGDKLKLACLDANEDTLKNLTTYFDRHGVRNYSVKTSTTEAMPFPDDGLDCIFTFNAVHHFNLLRFFRESARVMKNDGYLFIFTKLYELNGKDKWGIYFPRYDEKETRWYTLEEMKQAIEAAGSLSVESIAFFAHNRMAALEQLMTGASSQISAYTQEDMTEALKGFSIDLTSVFGDMRQESNFDENLLFIIKKEPKNSLEYLKIAAAYRSPGVVA
jgi:ubiquinone/menaquinone biosynthesis C-methylase UbiE